MCGIPSSRLWRNTIQYDEGCSLYCGESPSVLWRIFIILLRDTISTVGGYHQYCGSCSVLWWISSLLWRLLSKLGRYHQCYERYSVPWRDTISTLEIVHHCGDITAILCRDTISTVDDVHYTVEGYHQCCVGHSVLYRETTSTEKVVPKVHGVSLHGTDYTAQHWLYPPKNLLCDPIPSKESGITYLHRVYPAI